MLLWHLLEGFCWLLREVFARSLQSLNFNSYLSRLIFKTWSWSKSYDAIYNSHDSLKMQLYHVMYKHIFITKHFNYYVTDIVTGPCFPGK